ncbi:MAG: hypothetical protein OHK0029_20170 [Armatimonadaceae bacterium]
MQNIISILYFIYAAALVGGGAMGTKASGKPSSLIGGAVFAAVAVAAGILIRTNPRIGLIVGLVDAIAVAAFFAYRLMGGAKPMPAVPAIAMSLVAVGVTIWALTNLKPEVR